MPSVKLLMNVLGSVDGRCGGGQLQRVVQRRHQRRDAQPQACRAGGGVGQQLHRRDQRRRTDRLLQRPTTFEAEVLGPGDVILECRRVEAVGVALGE
jgi:hypothetical protein